MSERPEVRPTLAPAAGRLARTPRPHLVDESRPARSRRVAQPKVALYVRLDADLVTELERRAEFLDWTKTEAVEAAVRQWLES